MMRTYRTIFPLLFSLLLCTPALAEMCSLDDVPAATMLLPYFEVDWQDPQGVNTVFTVNNASPQASLAQVTLWTDWSLPTLTFNLFLTGYDVATVNLGEVFADGILPITSDAQSDPQDTVSPHGQNPAWDGSFAQCAAILPFGLPGEPVLSNALLAGIRISHTGQDSNGNGCLSENYGDGVARGYVTIDLVNDCSLVWPPDPGYFAADGTGVASNDNRLWGRYLISDRGASTAFGSPLVAIEASDGFTGSEATGYTFYGRHSTGGVDNREPLATTWAADYVVDEKGQTSTELLVWRDSTFALSTSTYPCDVGPSMWRPMGQTEVVAFDQEENAVELCFVALGGLRPPFPQDACFPLETQRVRVGSGDLATPFSAGWLFLNLNRGNAINDQEPARGFAQGQNLTQSHVTVVRSLGGQIQTGYPALVWSHACEDRSPTVTSTGQIPGL